MQTKKLFTFIDNSPTAFHAVSLVEEELKASGFISLTEIAEGDLSYGGKYYVTRNGSSIIAFKLPQNSPTGFMIAASHSDSPTFKIKPNAELETFGKYLRLNTERYGGMIMSSWFDRPLSVAGRVSIDTDEGVKTVNVNLDRDLLVIPNVAIHMSRNINSGYEYNARIDTLPLAAELSSETKLLDLVAHKLMIEPSAIIGHDLFLYCRQKGCIVGADDAFFLSPRIDNLECAYTTLQGFLSAENEKSVTVYALFDNEETGSETKQGAASDFLTLTVDRILRELQLTEKKDSILENSMMLSADNAHAMHPNHPELADAHNAPHMNGGIVIKYNASQRYTTDGVSAALFKKICRKAGVPTQVFANRSDMAGGSTLGSIATTKVSVKTVDIGLAQLAMHSATETAGVRDIQHMIDASTAFFASSLSVDGNAISIY